MKYLVVRVKVQIVPPGLEGTIGEGIASYPSSYLSCIDKMNKNFGHVQLWIIILRLSSSPPVLLLSLTKNRKERKKKKGGRREKKKKGESKMYLDWDVVAHGSLLRLLEA